MPIVFANLLTSVSLLGGMTPRVWYAVPLIVVISLVYGATRHENLKEILVHSFRSAIWMIGFMACIFVLVWIAGYWN